MSSYLQSNSITNPGRGRVYGGEIDRVLDSRRTEPRMEERMMRDPRMEERMMRDPRMEERMMRDPRMEEQIPPGMEDYPATGVGKSKTVSTWTLTSLILSAIALGLLIIFVIWYFADGEFKKGNTESIKNVINRETDLSPTFKNLTVTQDTDLGTTGSDTLTVNARVDSDLVPSGNRTKDLGSPSYRWDNVYVDSVTYDGVSIIQDTTENLIFIDGDTGFGYRKKVEEIVISSGVSSRSLTSLESGYLYNIGDSGVSNYTYNIYLPEATGSGVHYDMVFGTSIVNYSSDTFGILARSGDLYTGSLYVLEENDSVSATGDPDRIASFNSPGVGDGLIIDSSGPVNSTDATTFGVSTGIRRGSRLTFSDYESGYWNIEGTLVVSNGISSGYIVNPIK